LIFRRSATRAVCVALVLLAAAVVSIIAGLLACAGGAEVPNAVIVGGCAYAGAVGLLLSLLKYATG
jgi:predicted branched-subunit amino acid permease